MASWKTGKQVTQAQGQPPYLPPSSTPAIPPTSHNSWTLHLHPQATTPSQPGHLVQGKCLFPGEDPQSLSQQKLKKIQKKVSRSTWLILGTNNDILFSLYIMHLSHTPILQIPLLLIYHLVTITIPILMMNVLSKLNITPPLTTKFLMLHLMFIALILLIHSLSTHYPGTTSSYVRGPSGLSPRTPRSRNPPWGVLDPSSEFPIS